MHISIKYARTSLCLLIMAVLLFGSIPVQQASAAPDFKVLVFSKTAAFRHDSIPAGIAAIQSLGSANNFQVDATEDSSVFTTVNLAQYKAVIFLSTTGDILDANQKAAFQSYIESGGGYAGIHSASDTEHSWSWYGQLVGAFFSSHPGTQQANVKVADRVHGSTASLPAIWTRTDEWYNFDRNPRGTVHVLATLDEKSYTGGGMGYDHPIAWCQKFDGGRAWYTGGGHTSESFSDSLFKQHILGGIMWAAGKAKGDCSATVYASNNFQKQELVTGSNAPIAFDFTPDGRMFFIERTTGKVRVYHPDTNATSDAAALNIYGNFEDGLLGIAIDPGFSTNHWLYLYYSPAGSTAENRISRFTVNGDLLDLSSEKILLRVPTQRVECCHSAGDLEFGADGNLYLSLGDNTNPFASDGFAPIDETAGRANFDAQRTSGSKNDLRGKILRIKPLADGTYSIPSGNLFTDGSGKPEIYIMGTRNPYRFSLNPYTNTLYWGDVGPDAGGDNAARGPMGYDEFNMATSAGNYGWPYCIANNKAYVKYNFANSTSGAAFDCNAPVNSSPNNTGGQNLPAAKGAMIWYPYGAASDFPEITDQGGRTSMAGPVYKYDAANSSPYKLPAYFDKSLFIFDFSRFWFKELKFDDSGNLLKINPFLTNLSFDHPIYAKIGKDGSLYVSEYASGGYDGKISRILYTGGANQPPVVKAVADKTNGLSPLTVAFSTAGTSDPNGDPITFAWDFDGNGTIDSIAANPTFTYAANGNYNAKVTVTDDQNASSSVTIPITVGNRAPVVTINLPVPGGLFKWGDTIPYSVTVTDAEDGAIDCSRVTVLPALGHDTHSHPDSVQHGCSGTFKTVQSDTNIENTFYYLTASYTDNGGTNAAPLTGTSTVRILSMDRQAEYFDASSSGLLTEPTTDVGVGKDVGYITNGSSLTFKSVNLTGITGISARVASAGAGGTIEMRADSATGTLLSTLTVPVTGGWQSWTTVNGAVSSIPSGAHDIYFVFKGAAGYLFNVNVFTFSGQGIALPQTQTTTVAIKAGINGKFVSAANGGTGNLIANQTVLTAAERFELIKLADGNVALKSKANGQYVTAENAGASPLVANRATPDLWEEFTLVDAGNGQVAFKSAVNGKYVTADNAGASALIARAAVVDLWEKFTLFVQETSNVAFTAKINGKYVCADNYGTSPLIANRTAVDAWETFAQAAQPDGSVTLKAQANGKFVTAPNAGGSALIASSAAVAGTSEKLLEIMLANGNIALVSLANNQYVSADNSSNSLLANRSVIGVGEQYSITKLP